MASDSNCIIVHFGAKFTLLLLGRIAGALLLNFSFWRASGGLASPEVSRFGPKAVCVSEFFSSFWRAHVDFTPLQLSNGEEASKKKKKLTVTAKTSSSSGGGRRHRRPPPAKHRGAMRAATHAGRLSVHLRLPRAPPPGALLLPAPPPAAARAPPHLRRAAPWPRTLLRRGLVEVGLYWFEAMVGKYKLTPLNH